MRLALKQLGFNECYHHWAWFENPPDSIMWQAAYEAKWKGKGKFGRAEFDQLLGHCRVSYSPLSPRSFTIAPQYLALTFDYL